MKITVLVDLRVEIEPPSHVTRYLFWRRDGTEQERLEAERRALEEWAREFEQFVRDHRSQDPVSLTVVRVHEDRCSHCAAAWEADAITGEPCCCNAAVDEWQAARAERTA